MKYTTDNRPTTDAEFEQTVNAMSEREQAHFKMVVHTLAGCYGDTKAQAIIIVGHVEHGMAGVISLNCDAMRGAELMLSANDFFGYLNTIDAPPKEKFN
jgi:hypothetical protein